MSTERKTPAQRAADAVEKMEEKMLSLLEAVELYSNTDGAFSKRRSRESILSRARRYASSVEAVKRALK